MANNYGIGSINYGEDSRDPGVTCEARRRWAAQAIAWLDTGAVSNRNAMTSTASVIVAVSLVAIDANRMVIAPTPDAIPAGMQLAIDVGHAKHAVDADGRHGRAERQQPDGNDVEQYGQDQNGPPSA